MTYYIHREGHYDHSHRDFIEDLLGPVFSISARTLRRFPEVCSGNTVVWSFKPTLEERQLADFRFNQPVHIDLPKDSAS